MKKITYTLLFIFSLTTISKVVAQGNVTFGLKGGVSVAGFYGDDYDNFNFRGDPNPKKESLMNITGALAVNSEVGEWIWLKHEFWFVNRGSRITNNSGDQLTYNRGYLDVAPIQLALNLKGFQIFGGPQAGIMLYINDELKLADGTTIETKEVTNESVLDFGFIVGSEYEFPFGLNVGARYVRGFHGIDDENDMKWYNQALLITAGWTFGKNL